MSLRVGSAIASQIMSCNQSGTWFLVLFSGDFPARDPAGKLIEHFDVPEKWSANICSARFQRAGQGSILLPFPRNTKQGCFVNPLNPQAR
jgi:hypothetical protein